MIGNLSVVVLLILWQYEITVHCGLGVIIFMKQDPGDGTNINHNVPKKVGNDSDWLNVSAGNGHTHAVKTNETAWGCGGNSDGRVGDGTQVNKISFVQIGLGSTWKSISSGNHCMAIRTDGTLVLWSK